MSEQMTIKISYTEDGMFGPDEENRDGVDILASFAKYDEMLTGELLKVFPSSEIEIENGIEDKHTVDPEDYESPDFYVEVGEIIHRVWESWDWVVVEQTYAERLGLGGREQRQRVRAEELKAQIRNSTDFVEFLGKRHNCISISANKIKRGEWDFTGSGLTTLRDKLIERV